MKDIYASIPINKTASLVVNQKNCTTELTIEQKRDNLVAQYKKLRAKMSAMPKKSEKRKALGMEMHELTLKISGLRKQHKFDRHLNYYIVDIIKKRMTKNQWHALVDEASKLKKVGLEGML